MHAAFLRRLASALAVLAVTCGADEKDAPRLATTPEVRESGLLDTLVAAFAKETGGRVTVVTSPKEADVLLLPAPEAAEPGAAAPPAPPEAWWTPLLVVGPAAGAKRSYGELNYDSWARGRSPLGTRGARTGSSASRLLQEIALSAHPFVSVGDRSEAHLRELKFWGTDGPPRPERYVETREPMAKTLAIADEKSAYTLCDAATFLRLRTKVRLAVVLARDKELRVSYCATLAESAVPERAKAAGRLRDWLGSDKCHAVLKTFQVDGERPFYAPGEEPAPTLRGRLDPDPPVDAEEDR
jgi:tungstate transport system substrate-binding protein